MTASHIPPHVLDAIAAHAREAFPEECCGYLRGNEVVRCRNAQADGEHPTHPNRSADTGFVIAGRELFDFARAFQTDRPPTVVYHSHTNGRAYLSEVDRMNAVATGKNGVEPTYPVQHLVIGVTVDGVVEAALFAWSDAAAEFVEVFRMDRQAFASRSR